MPLSSRTRTVVIVAQGIALSALLAHALHTGLDLGHPQLDGLFDSWVYNAMMLSAALACLLRAVLVPADRVAWLVLGAGALAWSGGDIYYSVVLADVAEPPMPSVSDALFLSFYPCAYVGLALMAKRHLRDFHASLWIDALIGALAVSAVASAVLYDLVSVGIAGDTLSVITTLAYPVGDVLLLALVTGLFALTGWRPGWTWALIGVSLALSAFGDSAYLYLTATGGYAEGTLLDSVWPASMLLLGAAAWRPQPRNRARLEGPLILAMPAFFSCTAMGLLIIGQFEPLDPLALALACGTLVALIVRMAVTLSENLRMVAASREEALTDALTGLGNRRKLIADLDELLGHARPEGPHVLVLFDLDGFKGYNDGFGHLAGDALLERLGTELAGVASSHGDAYRLGGDEFCVLLAPGDDDLGELLAACARALSESGGGFDVHASFGAVHLPHEATTAFEALQIADQRMYAHKAVRRQAGELETVVHTFGLKLTGPGAAVEPVS